MSNQNTITMTPEQLKAIINKAAKNAKAEVKTQTTLTDAAKILGVKGNWGTLVNMGGYVAPGIARPVNTPAPQMPAKVDVWVNMLNNDGNASICAFGSQEEADRSAKGELLDVAKAGGLDVEEDAELWEIIESIREESGYQYDFKQERFSLSLKGPENPNPEGTELSAEKALMDAGEIDYIECKFQPQAWQNDYAVDVDPEGPTTWRMPISEALEVMNATRAEGHKHKTAEDIQDNTDRDNLRHSIHTPEWIKDWSGPFEIYVDDIHLSAEAENSNEALVRSTVRDQFLKLMDSNLFAVDLHVRPSHLSHDEHNDIVEEATDEWMERFGLHYAKIVDSQGTMPVEKQMMNDGWLILNRIIDEKGRAHEDKGGSAPSM